MQNDMQPLTEPRDEGEYRIEIKNISKSFGTKKVLKGITCSLRPGEIFGLLGPSGAGKTTLVKILTGRLIPDEGEAKLFQSPTGQLNRSVYRRMGMVMDEPALYERLSCRDNLGLFARLYGVPDIRIRELLEKTGLKEAAKRPVNRLSKGMKQRLSIARALLHQPQLLFLDEPTSGLDPSTAAKIHGLLLEAQQKGATIFLTTHNMEEATKLCHNVALLHQGSIVEYGSPKDICRSYNHQNEIHILKTDGTRVCIKNDGSQAELLAECARENQIAAIHSTEPNLETVFMELTGRGFL